MKILLDTHFAFWVTSAQGRLHRPEAAFIEQAQTILVSAVSVWELQLKWASLHRSGDRKGPIDPLDLLARLQVAAVETISLTVRQAASRLEREITHNDPFDRLLLLQAQDIGAKLLTRDHKLQGHPLVVQV